MSEKISLDSSEFFCSFQLSIFNFEKNKKPEQVKKNGTAKLPNPKKACISPVECAHSLQVC